MEKIPNQSYLEVIENQAYLEYLELEKEETALIDELNSILKRSNSVEQFNKESLSLIFKITEAKTKSTDALNDWLALIGDSSK